MPFTATNNNCDWVKDNLFYFNIFIGLFCLLLDMKKYSGRRKRFFFCIFVHKKWNSYLLDPFVNDPLRYLWAIDFIFIKYCFTMAEVKENKYIKMDMTLSQTTKSNNNISELLFWWQIKCFRWTSGKSSLYPSVFKDADWVKCVMCNRLLEKLELLRMFEI